MNTHTEEQLELIRTINHLAMMVEEFKQQNRPVMAMLYQARREDVEFELETLENQS